MKKHIWSDSTKEWEGFRFKAYRLDWEKLEAMPLTLESGNLPPEDRRVIDRDPKTGAPVLVHESATQDRAENATAEGLQLTVGGIYRRIARCKFELPEQLGIFLRLKVKTQNGEVVLKGSSFNCTVLRELLALKAEGVESYSSEWFWYDSDSCKVDPGELYSFFVVSGDRIVRESVSFHDGLNCGFDPAVFKSENDSNFLWCNDSEWCQARTRFWYRKFYTETRIGQLMVLRPDEPILYHYERPVHVEHHACSRGVPVQETSAAGSGSRDSECEKNFADSAIGVQHRKPPQEGDFTREMQFVTSLKMYRLLWVALPLLVALAFPSLKDYMAIAAAALGASFLWLCWETRKLGFGVLLLAAKCRVAFVEQQRGLFQFDLARHDGCGDAAR